MSFSDFTISELESRFGLSFTDQIDLFANVPPVAISRQLQETLQETLALALAISTEKARSELIIAPVLVEVRRQLDRRVSLFSGIDLNVDPDQGLKGTCHFIFGLTSIQVDLDAPIAVIVEAKNENIKQGVGQCAAEMLAAQLFNQKRQHGSPIISGVVTTGSEWRFLTLSGKSVAVDLTLYSLQPVERIVGILVHMIKRAQSTATLTAA